MLFLPMRVVETSCQVETVKPLKRLHICSCCPDSSLAENVLFYLVSIIQFAEAFMTPSRILRPTVVMAEAQDL